MKKSESFTNAIMSVLENSYSVDTTFDTLKDLYKALEQAEKEEEQCLE